MLQFGNGETYYDYISPFFQEGEFGGSGGMCVRSGYTHIALHPATGEEMQAALAHEMAHAALAHLQAPLWLEEGITQLAEEEAQPDWARFNLDAQTATELRNYWRERGLADFWWGKGFFLADEGRKFSYLLAQVLFRLLSADYKPSLATFVRHAHVDDAGEIAAREFLGCGLAGIAAKFLGEGTWEPVPVDGAGYCRRGLLHASKGNLEPAIADLNDGLRIAPELAEGYVSRGLVHYGMQQYSAAIADYQQAIKLDPRSIPAHNNLAWAYATCPESAIRNGGAAVEHAAKSCELSGYSQWYCLETLAASHAESDDFEEARRWCKESLALAPPEEREACRERMRLYKDGQRYREPGNFHSLSPPSETTELQRQVHSPARRNCGPLAGRHSLSVRSIRAFSSSSWSRISFWRVSSSSKSDCEEVLAVDMVKRDGEEGAGVDALAVASARNALGAYSPAGPASEAAWAKLTSRQEAALLGGTGGIFRI